MKQAIWHILLLIPLGHHTQFCCYSMDEYRLVIQGNQTVWEILRLVAREITDLFCCH